MDSLQLGMSAENVTRAQEGFELFNSGDIDAWLDWFNPDIVWHTRVDEPDAGVYRGREGVRALVEMWLEQFEQLRCEGMQYFDEGEWVLVPCRLRGRGRESAIEVDEPYVYAHHFGPAGRSFEVFEYRTVEEARASIRAD
jgi:ketosteroid isomerase-like protein